MNKDVQEMLRAATVLGAAALEFDKADQDTNRFEARLAMNAVRKAINLANLSSDRMRRYVEKMPRD